MSSSPNYGDLSSWAAHPDKPDNADRVPSTAFKDHQATATVDVFFLHPTTYTGHKTENQWNGRIDEPKLNKRTDEGTILHQASIFNEAGRVFAPRYRQAHLHAYFTKDTVSAQKAFQLAYQDVKKAFTFYLENHNQGRPIIIAGHSQGTNHATQLLLDFFDGKPLQDQLVVAYLVGMPIARDTFQNISPCKEALQTGCFCSWRTFKKGHLPKQTKKGNHIAVTNPLNWKTDQTYAGFELNEGGVLRKYNKAPISGLTDAVVEQGLLWAAKPRFFGNIFITFKNYHIADYNLYWVNVRRNVADRTRTFLNDQH